MITALPIEGAWLTEPQIHSDGRGAFLEFYRSDQLHRASGHALELRQASMSISAGGVIRGLHFTSGAGQAKCVTCVQGSVWDVVVDVRVGSPTFGQWVPVLLDDQSRRVVYLANDLAHGFCVTSPWATLIYLQSAWYDPTMERTVNPTDPDLNINWPARVANLSVRDSGAPTLREAREQNLLPEWKGQATP